MSIYSDSEWRYQNDAEFHALVDCLAAFAEKQGYTPGELKQAAFMAAYLVEERNPRPVRFPIIPPIVVRQPVMGEPLLCEHANECPNVCPCEAGCYCRTRTCVRAERYDP